MNIRLHKKARTTPAIRKEIQESGLSERAIAKEYNISRTTASKWKKRDSVDDRSHRPENLHATLSSAEEYVVCELRRTLLLPLDDLLVVVREFINQKMSRSALDRCLRRHGISNLKDIIPESEGQERQYRKFNDYEPGFIHVDVKYLPVMPGESSRKYLFVAIDRATRWVFMEIKECRTAESARSFIKNLIEKSPFAVLKILTDNGKEFTDRFSPAGERIPSGGHIFDIECSMNGIEHRLIKVRHPQTNGMVERFNGRVEEVLSQTRFKSSSEMEETLIRYCSVYNHYIPQKNLGHITPVAALKKWQTDRPELFKKIADNLSGPDR
jgi:transposase InsO family protein